MSSKPSQELTTIHIPVMVSEVLDHLITDRNGIYLDGTVGLGGHATHILNTLSPSGRLLGLDRDEKALSICKEMLSSSSAFSCHYASYDKIPQILHEEGITVVSGILLDLGLSSLQLDSQSRGFSFQNDSELDMRFDQSCGQTAADLINGSSEKEIADIIYQYGEERLSRRIAKSIKRAGYISTVFDLKEAIRKSTPPQFRNKTLARVFQALRISVNNELDRLERFLGSFIDCLVPGGRIVIISYHSLEDRMVKQCFRGLKNNNALEILTKKPLPPTKEEQNDNSRSRSAKLRAGARI